MDIEGHHVEGGGYLRDDCRLRQPARPVRPETRGMALFLISATAAAKTELTNDNFDELVFGTGKSAFIKFQAPW